MRRILACLLLCATATAMAMAQEPPRLEDGADAHAAFYLARAAHVVPLHRSRRMTVIDPKTGYKRMTDLRVSLVVLDDGTSTDLSPRWMLYLAVFNDINEHGQAWALEPVGAAYRFKGAHRRAAGIYVAEIMTVDESGKRCGFVPARIVVDARDLTALVRRGGGVAEFDARRITAPIGIKAEIDKC